MEKAVDSLETMFSKTEKDLDYMSRRLDYQLENMQDVDQKVNPVKLMKKLELIKTEYASVVQNVSAIQEAQKEFTDTFRSQLLTLTEMLQMLEQNTGQSRVENDGEKLLFDELSSLLGIPTGQLESQAQGVSTLSQNTFPSESCSAEAINAVPPKHLRSANESGDNKSDKSSTSTNMRRNSEEFCEVSVKEFQSVSQLLKQRLKREDVNKVYRRLWQHFKEEKNMNKLTPKDMNDMGLRVTGASGVAKLKVLRALKLCQIGKNGDVTLL